MKSIPSLTFYDVIPISPLPELATAREELVAFEIGPRTFQILQRINRKEEQTTLKSPTDQPSLYSIDDKATSDLY